MKRLRFQPGQEKSREALVEFLEECRHEAAAAGDWRLVSISLRVGHIDPLAVLESIFEPEETHFYLEKASEDCAVAGADAVTAFSFSGSERFEKARAFVDDTLERSICIEDEDIPFSGPRFFFGFSFFDDPGKEADFDGATGFVPRWQVARHGDTCVATANVKVDVDSSTSALAERVWRANEKFDTFQYRYGGSGEGAREALLQEEYPSLIEKNEVVSRRQFEAGVREILREIESGRVEKVVLARPVDLRFSGALRPLLALNRLRMEYSNCYTFSIGNGRGAHFIGASPERLARREGDSLETEALAGSAPRGATASQDAFFARRLLESEKDRREHGLVVEAIVRRLSRLGVRVGEPEPVRLLRLNNVQHLRTGLHGAIPGGVSFVKILAALHPTPAVGGTPREEATRLIRRFEEFPRGLYAGAIGWIDAAGNGEFTVPIRSVSIRENEARFFVGAGIVPGSDPSEEWQETEIKGRPIMDALLRAPAGAK